MHATLIGYSAIALWSLLALFTRWAGPVPPFKLLAMTFALAFCVMLVKWALCRQSPLRFARVPVKSWLLGTGGLFGYHACYFYALQHAPAIEASLLCYLWPLLIVLFSGLLPGHKLQLPHLLAALMGLAGTLLIVIKPGHHWGGGEISGYLAALIAAFLWAGYSVTSRLQQQVATDSVGWFCLATAVLGLIAHQLFEAPMAALSDRNWLAILALGLGPVGIAFFTWDYGMKHGNVSLLGLLAYSAPLLSTLLLVVFAVAEGSPRLWLACLLIVTSALLPWLWSRLRAGKLIAQAQ
ncbi:DMT family transporter [Pokkaliibacter sp. CJK22405]|uniref:aromatic amino acid exporter YddG n=1 Tax=Pokkaliibacter sp. CJK22405 TaxID=3384615 RepID=UPI003984E1C2